MGRIVHCGEFMEQQGTQLRDGLYGFAFRDIDLRRVSEGEEKKTYNIKALWQRSHEIINLAAQGWKQTQIAEILNISEATVSLTLNSDLGKKKLAEIRYSRDEDAKKQSAKINALTNKAIETYNEILDNEDGQATLADRMKVSDSILLELSGLRAPTKIQASSVSMTLSAAEIAEFKQRGIKAAQEAGQIIDITEEPPASATRPLSSNEIPDENLDNGSNEINEVGNEAV